MPTIWPRTICGPRSWISTWPMCAMWLPPLISLSPGLPRLSGGFYVRMGHPLLGQGPVSAQSLLPFGIGSVRLPEAVQLGLGVLMGLGEGKRLPLAVECDDLSLLKSLAATTDTVIGCSDAATVQDVDGGRLVRLDVLDIPPMFADMAIVSLKGRSYSLMAQFAVDFIQERAQAVSFT
jgi:DNA-binding transcriptional LysR family regulator